MEIINAPTENPSHPSGPVENLKKFHRFTTINFLRLVSPPTARLGRRKSQTSQKAHTLREPYVPSE